MIQGELTLGMLLAAQTIALSLKTQIDSVMTFVQQLPTFEAEVLRLEDVLEQPHDPLISEEQSREWSRSNDRLSGEIVLNNVSFGFAAIKEPLIQNFSLTIHPGQRIALIGGSGSGKSTLAKLIAGLHQPSDGEILFDGAPLVNIPRPSAPLPSMVQQDVQIYGCSVKDNLSLWNPSIPASELRKPVKMQKSLN